MFEKKICRFCALHDDYCVDIFSEEGMKNNVRHKVKVCAPISVLETDEFPKEICLNCLSSLDQVYEFYQKIKIAQLKLKNLQQEQSLLKKRPCSLGPNEERNPKKISFGDTTLTFGSHQQPDALNPVKSDPSFPPLFTYTYISKSSGLSECDNSTNGTDGPKIPSTEQQNNQTSSKTIVISPIDGQDNRQKDLSPDADVPCNNDNGDKPPGKKSIPKDQNLQVDKIQRADTINFSSDQKKRNISSDNVLVSVKMNSVAKNKNVAEVIGTGKSKSSHPAESESKEPSKSNENTSTKNPKEFAKPTVALRTYERSQTISKQNKVVPKTEPLMENLMSKQRNNTSEKSNIRFKKCRHCDKEFREDILLQHENLHSGSPVFTCAECDGFFLHESTFEKHHCTPSK